MSSTGSMIKKTYLAAVSLRSAGERQIKAALHMLADSLEEQAGALLRANARDL